VPNGQLRHLLGEPADLTPRRLAHHQPHLQPDLHPTTTQRDIGQPTLVPAMHPDASDATARATRLLARRSGPNPYTGGDQLNPFDNDTSKMRQQLCQTAMITPA
jgi:hypothetical protein